MPLQVVIIHSLHVSKCLNHKPTEACQIGAFEGLEVVDTAIIQLS
jgi:hypothetical protein